MIGLLAVYDGMWHDLLCATRESRLSDLVFIRTRCWQTPIAQLTFCLFVFRLRFGTVLITRFLCCSILRIVYHLIESDLYSHMWGRFLDFPVRILARIPVKNSFFFTIFRVRAVVCLFSGFSGPRILKFWLEILALIGPGAGFSTFRSEFWPEFRSKIHFSLPFFE